MTDRDILRYATVALDDEGGALLILDQTLLPGEIRVLRLTKQEEIWEAIARLRVRGAPAIGVAAAFGLYLAARELGDCGRDECLARLYAAAKYLDSARLTAVNLSWALARMLRAARACDGGIAQIKARLRAESLAIEQEDVAMCRAIGEHGLRLLHDGDGILTHCNAGQLAASRYGTALAPIHLGTERGMRFRVYADETRPLLQGARLTAFELMAGGVDTTLICDNMASQVMKNGFVNAVLVGCDRIAANGDVCNKIGTSGVAILAKHYGIPFYVLGPTSSVDMNIARGEDIVIEQRDAEEVTRMWYSRRMAPAGVKVYNPAFDVTDHSLITAIITEHGVASPPYTRSLSGMCQTTAQRGFLA